MKRMTNKTSCVFKKAAAWILTLSMIFSIMQPSMIAQAEDVNPVAQGSKLTKTDTPVKMKDAKTGEEIINEKRDIVHIVDGIKGSEDALAADNWVGAPDAYEELADARPFIYMELDLGDVYDISEVKMWRYVDGRKYNNTIIVASDDKTFDANDKVIWNANTITADTYGDCATIWGTGTDGTYEESAEGKSFPVKSATTGRYVRVYMRGSTTSAGTQHWGDHVYEIEVYGDTVGTKHTVTIPKTDVLKDGYQVSPDKAYTAEADGTYKVNEGSDFRFVIAITEGFTPTTAVKANGEELIAVDGMYTIENVTADQTITVEGVTEMEGHKVIFPADKTGYSIQAVDDSIIPVPDKGSYHFVINLDANHNMSSPVVKINNGADTLTPDEKGVYKIANITGNINVTIEGITQNPEMANLALGKQVTVKLTSDNSVQQTENNRPEDLAVDGDTTLNSYCGFGADQDPSSRYLEINLGRVQQIGGINMWRYFADGRTYKNTVIALSQTADFANPVVVYNSDADNVHGFGAGTDSKYQESNAGKSFSLKQLTNAQYVRVYMCGSDKGDTNHVIEVQAMGISTEYNADALKNATVYQDFPTHYQDEASNKNPDGSLKHVGGQVTHPDVVYVKDGWNGYKYWVVYTPNVMLTSQYENPYIAASDDGSTWVEPAGIKNPIEPEPISKRYHNCDADMVYNKEMDAMMAYWNWADDQGGGDGAAVRLRISYDGIHWGVPVTYDEETGIWTKPKTDAERALKAPTQDKDGLDNSFITAITSKARYDMLSPTFTYDEYRKIFVMWANNAKDVGYSNGQKNYVETRVSEDGINWSVPTKVNNFLGKTAAGRQLAPWHQDISYVKELKEYWALSQCFVGDAPDGSMLYLTKSKDGVNWQQVGTKPILNPGQAGSWDDFQIYRSSFIFDMEGADSVKDGKLRVWYSALQADTAGKMVIDSTGEKTIQATAEDTRIWRMGYTENSYIEIMKALNKDKDYQLPEEVDGKSLTLTVDNETLYADQTANVKAVFDPIDTSDGIIKYSSSDAEIATVSAIGVVKAGTKTGDVVITGETASGLKGTVTIKVKAVEKGEIRYEVGPDRILYLENYYWSDDAPAKNGLNASKNYDDENRIDSPVMLWNTVPDSLKDNTVILLIAERSLNNTDALQAWIKNNVELCNANKIPCAVQIANGETNPSTLVPLKFWRDLASDNKYLVGFNAAEMYNRFAGDNRQYVIDMIKLGIDLGVSMMWTDTNIFGSNGVLYDWLSQDDELANLMKDNKEYISLMTKESYGSNAANTDSLFLGLWLTDYIGNWGIASDWWHWQIDNNGSLFQGKPGDDAWKQCLTWPENMYTQDVVLAASQGATCFKSEAQWYSNASKGMRTPTYQYSMIPFLEKLISKDVKIPTKAEMQDRTKAIVSGAKNWNKFNYSDTYSNLYPATARYGLIPYVPDTFPAEATAGFENVITKPVNKAIMDKIYPAEKSQGTAWCENFGDTWYWMNSSEDKDVKQQSLINTPINGSESVTISSGPHNFAIVKETADNLNVYLSNYRLDKSELWDGTTYPGGFSDQSAYDYVWVMCQRLLDGTAPDTTLRDTVITVKNGVEPKVEFVTPNTENKYEKDNYVRPYTSKVEKKEGSTDEWVITISHNGMVEFNITTGDKDVAANEIQIKNNAVKIPLFGTAAIESTVLPANAGDKRIEWTSSDTKIATVNDRGEVTGVNGGTAKIKAALKGNTSIFKECTVEIIDTKATAVEMSESSIVMDEGESATVTAKLLPENTSRKDITWKSSNEEIATVVDGKIQSNKPGIVTITAMSEYGISGTTKVEVKYASSKMINPSTYVVKASSTQSGDGSLAGATDGSASTFWHSQYSPAVSGPHWIQIGFGDAVKTLNKFSYLPRPNKGNGSIYGYKLYIIDPNNVEKLVAEGTFSYPNPTNYTQEVKFDAVEAKAIKLVAVTANIGGTVSPVTASGTYVSAGEICAFEQSLKPSAQEILDTITSLPRVEAGDKKVTLPEKYGYEVSVIGSSNLSIIDAAGNVVAMPEKETEVTLDIQVKNDQDIKSKKLTVVVAKTTVIPVTGITISKSSHSMKPGEKLPLTATVLPSNATDKTVKWNSNAAAVATVDNNGLVTAVGEGTAIITVTAGSKTATCTITVQKPVVPTKPVVTVTGVKLDKSSLTLVKGKSYTLKANVLPSNATDKAITYTSSNSKVATVDKTTGKITAKAKGTATITTKSTNGKKAVCKVTVPEVKLNAPSAPLQIGKKSAALKISGVYPTSDKPASWKSSNTKVVKVNSKGELTALKKTGSAKITVTMKSGATATCTIKVQKTKVTTKSLTMSSKSLTLLKGKKKTLTVKRNPITATEKITWKTSNKKVVTVDSKGRVTAKGTGAATITAITSNGKKTTCKITVPGITLKATKATIKVKKTYTIGIKSKVVKSDKIVSCKSSNTKVATVDKKGKITGKKSGSATITVTMKSGAKATFKVTVKK